MERIGASPATGALLNALLAQQKALILGAWQRVLQRQAPYRDWPQAERAALCQEGFAVYRTLLQQDDGGLVIERITPLVRRALACGLPPSVLQGAFLLGRELIAARIQAPDGSRIPAPILRAARRCVTQAGDRLLLLLADVYAGQLAADLHRQLAAAHTLSQQLHEAAVHDELTRLYNYRFLVLRLEEEIDRARRYGRPVALIMADLDGLKAVNDTYGHPAGNAVLQRVAQTLAAGVRGLDLLARYGGDEFAVILPETATVAAVKLAERLRRAVAAQTAPPLPTVTISAGVSSWHAADRAVGDLVGRADAALYAAKRAGRNRVRSLEQGSRPAPDPRRGAVPQRDPLWQPGARPAKAAG